MLPAHPEALLTLQAQLAPARFERLAAFGSLRGALLLEPSGDAALRGLGFTLAVATAMALLPGPARAETDERPATQEP